MYTNQYGHTDGFSLIGTVVYSNNVATYYIEDHITSILRYIYKMWGPVSDIMIAQPSFSKSLVVRPTYSGMPNYFTTLIPKCLEVFSVR